jgi:hypothetical protein
MIKIVSPFPEDQMEHIYGWMEEFRKQMVDDFTPQDLSAVIQRGRDAMSSGAKSYAILIDGEVVGAVWGEHLGDNVYMGHLAFDRYTLTPKEKLSATRDAVARFFTDGARKIVWQLFTDNRPFRLFLRRLGAEHEGTMRQSTRREGKLTDVDLMASFPEGAIQ